MSNKHWIPQYKLAYCFYDNVKYRFFKDYKHFYEALEELSGKATSIQAYEFDSDFDSFILMEDLSYGNTN